MHPQLTSLQPYPFERLRALCAGVRPPVVTPLRLSIGEPQHETPDLIRRAVTEHLDGLSVYPMTAGLDALREVMARWFERRYQLPPLDATAQVLPVNGTREALFAFAQCVVDVSANPKPAVICPNPFYQIYEGAALLAGAEPVFLNQAPHDRFTLDLASLAPTLWQRAQLIYVCSPGNPTGRVLSLDEWRTLFEWADRYGVIIASDECYSEIYPSEQAPPIGGLEAASRLGRPDFRNLVVFTSLSKRSNAPGLRSGGVAGDATLLRQFLLYRTYHGCAMSQTVQHASVAAWSDETHVVANRARYREKFDLVTPRLATVMDVEPPDAGFYLWAGVRRDSRGRWDATDDAGFARALFAETHVTVLPGQFLAREAHGTNPGRGFVRIALVPERDACIEAVERIVRFCQG